MSPPPADLQAVVDLAAAPAFRLGGLEVRPSTREVCGDDGGAIAEPRVLQVLIALAEAEGAVVSRDVLIRRCWEGRIVGEDAINRAISKVRQLAELTTPPAFVVETVPRVGHRLLPRVVADAPPIAAGSSRVPSAAPVTDRRRLLFGGGAATVAVAGAGLGAWALLGPRMSHDALVAVLPFDNLSADPQLGFFADGLAEDILSALIRGGMKVTARSSSFQFRGAAKGGAAKALKAGYLLDGSVMREGPRLRVIAHLSDTRTQEDLWSETYDRDVAQGLQIEDEIATQVAQALRVRLIPAAKPAIDPQTYELYLHGLDGLRGHSPESVAQGLVFLHLAIDRAPSFAQGWAQIARGCWLQGYYQSAAVQEATFARGVEAARRAIALDPRNGSAYATLSRFHRLRGGWDEITRLQQHALALAPGDPEVLLSRGVFLRLSGHIAAAVPVTKRAQAQDPLDLYANSALFAVLVDAARFDEAERSLATIVRTWPGQLGAFWNPVQLDMARDRLDAAAERLRDKARRPPLAPAEDFDVPALALSAASHGTPGERQAAARELVRFASLGYGYAAEAMMLLSRLGALDEGLAVARALYLKTGEISIAPVEFRGYGRFPLHGEQVTSYLYSHLTANLRRGGRLKPVFDGLGLTDFWRRTGRPDVADAFSG